MKKSSATYQKIVNKMFKHQTGRNIKMYIDDMIIKSKMLCSNLAKLAEIFQVLKRFNMYLNPFKYVF